MRNRDTTHYRDFGYISSLMNLYKAIDVWERQDSRKVVRYRCVESLNTGKFSVQSAEFYRDGKQSEVSDRQFIELLTEDDPAGRAGEYTSLSEAITAHKREFADHR
jgi:hypothetical protein